MAASSGESGESQGLMGAGLSSRPSNPAGGTGGNASSGRNTALGCIVLIVILAIAITVGVWACGGASGCGCSKVDVDQAAVLTEMQTAFPDHVQSVKVSGSPGDVAIDVYTDYYPDPDVAVPASGMARIAAQSATVLATYPSTTITAKVYSQGDTSFYITRATATYKDGTLSAPMDVFVNDVLKQ